MNNKTSFNGLEATINGLWNIILKINLALMPFILLWGIWVSRSIFEMQAWADVGPRYTEKDAQLMKANTIKEVRDQIDVAVEKITDSFKMHTDLGGHPIIESRMRSVESRLHRLEDKK